ncbi:hypothetical protein D1227_06340 [Henriciella mobilis]|uniref:hypothetical protein n=1 Tax=Henriciella mobilis TaxID=2305467 RepID=UPI000E66B1FA|nr:hypothetical protein [Henriciella mobilis]RIJ15970.1 hypothetical protein D1231_09260 [Henriciella mobilis]RIJ21180.1 hypothetical protein D1227_12800 [Henriciella mobilis]RIJ23119.1 hypothetical protein D1227_06340 [Henriciella mobilis]
MAKRAGRKRNLKAKRYPNGSVHRHDERVGPTPELEARRKALLGGKNAAGETDCVLDHLASPVSQVLTQKQAEAGRRYATARLRALRAAGVTPEAKSPRLSEWIDRGSSVATLPADDGRAAFEWRKARQCVYDAGSDVRRVIERVCIDNQPPRGHEVGRLRIGLDALIRLWRL